MAETARRLLVHEYGLRESRIRVIPHGVPPMPPTDQDQAKATLGLAGHTVVATFGLVDPRKGLEYAIRAMQAVAAEHPDALYLILGRTHPEFVHTSGESYRTELTTLVESLGLSENVRFIDRYLTDEDVVAYLRATDVYVTPYLDPNQITSGTLAYALGAGRAIVSTPYLHAAEVLAEGRGILIDFRSEQALADGVNLVLGDSELRMALEDKAYEYGRHTFWPIVGRRALNLYREAAGLASRALPGTSAWYPVNDQQRRPPSEREADGCPTTAGLAAIERSRPRTRETRLESLEKRR
jgi:glycosyltransferase involved in cell wall biosynthesis